MPSYIISSDDPVRTYRSHMTRDKTLIVPTNYDSVLGCSVIPSVLFLRMYGEDFSFACRGQVEWLAYYESQRMTMDMCQYWVQYRGVSFAGEIRAPKFPDVGFAYPKYTDRSLTKLVDGLCVVPQDLSNPGEVTTKIWKCRPLKLFEKPLKYGFAFAYGNVGILRHFYDCPAMRYVHDDDSEQGARDHGRHVADELIICDYENLSVDIWRRIDKSYSYDMVLYADKAIEWAVGDESIGLWHINWNLKTRTVASELEVFDTSKGVIEAHYPRGINIVNTDHTVMLTENDRPKIAMYPADLTFIGTSLVTRYKDKDYTFVYDPVLSGQIVYTSFISKCLIGSSI